MQAMSKQNILNVAAYVICSKPENFKVSFMLKKLFFINLLFHFILLSKYDELLYFKDKKGIPYYIILFIFTHFI